MLANTLAKFIIHKCQAPVETESQITVFDHCTNSKDETIHPTILAQALMWKQFKQIMTRGQENGGLFGWDITLDRQYIYLADNTVASLLDI